MYKHIFLILFIFCCFTANSQTFELQGTVYDYANRQPVDAVSVICTCGSGTVTGSNGHYTLRVSQQDSVYFSYLGKNTVKYPLDTIKNIADFEIGLHIDARWLPEVKVFTHNYRLDSIQNRRDYAKIFDYKKPGLRINSNTTPTYIPGSVTAGLDLDALINMFRFRRNRQIQSFQNRLLQEEQDKYIDHRYSKRLVKQLTALEPPEIDSFMTAYRPQYDILQQMNDLELGYYVQLCFKDYTRQKMSSPARRTILGVE